MLNPSLISSQKFLSTGCSPLPASFWQAAPSSEDTSRKGTASKPSTAGPSAMKNRNDKASGLKAAT